MNVGDVLVHILIVVVAAKAAAEVAERVGLPAVVAEILAGVLIGPSVLGMVGSDDVLRVLGEIGVILLLLGVGMEMNLGELVGRAALAVGVVGVVIPFVTGAGVAAGFGEDARTAVFVGAALTATSVGITARVFSDLRVLATIEARIVLGAAVADDVLGLLILTVVVRIAEGGSVSALSVSGIAVGAVAFLVLTSLVGSRLVPPLIAFIQRYARSAGTLVALVFAFTLAVAELASAVKLAPIVGAFVAGLVLARSDASERIRRELTPLGHVFIPVFFLQIGIDADVGAFARPGVLGLAAALFAVASVGKILAAVGSLGVVADRAVVGLGMLPRGEVGLIFAGLGLREGILDQDLYAALLLVVLTTTLVAPPLLRWRLLHATLRARERSAGAESAEPQGGWLKVVDGRIELVAEPPPRLALHLALQAAVLARSARPGTSLLDWFGGVTGEPLRWDRAATAELIQLLMEGNHRSWRFLDTTGVLERALPELATAVRRRQADPFELDPTRALRWSLVERLNELRDPAIDVLAAEEFAKLKRPELLLLAALILDTAEGGPPPVALARQLVKRLDLGAAAEQEVALLVGESELLRAAAGRADAFDEAVVVPIAAHLHDAERARALYLLTLALDGLDGAARARLDSAYDLVQSVLARSEVAARDVQNLAIAHSEAARRLVTDPRVAERIAAAPTTYLVTQDPAVLARQAALLEPPPVSDGVRVAVDPVGDGSWRIDVAARDRRGLLAAITGALAEVGLDVADATAATWPDGGVVDSFMVETPWPPDPAKLQAALADALRAPLSSPPVPEAKVVFDDVASPWYTLCQVAAPDKPGLLHALTTAMAAAGADIHGARIGTRDGLASDRFELTDGRGNKLDAATEAGVVTAIANGVDNWRPRPRGPRRLRRRDRANLQSSRNTEVTTAQSAPPTVPDGQRRPGSDRSLTREGSCNDDSLATSA